MLARMIMALARLSTDGAGAENSPIVFLLLGKDMFHLRPDTRLRELPLAMCTGISLPRGLLW